MIRSVQNFGIEFSVFFQQNVCPILTKTQKKITACVLSIFVIIGIVYLVIYCRQDKKVIKLSLLSEDEIDQTQSPEIVKSKHKFDMEDAFMDLTTPIVQEIPDLIIQNEDLIQKSLINVNNNLTVSNNYGSLFDNIILKIKSISPEIKQSTLLIFIELNDRLDIPFLKDKINYCQREKMKPIVVIAYNSLLHSNSNRLVSELNPLFSGKNYTYLNIKYLYGQFSMKWDLTGMSNSISRKIDNEQDLINSILKEIDI